MDPLRIAVRVVFVYVLLLVMVRAAGKRAARQGSPFDFTVALIVGDMVDDLLWGEVNAAEFSVAAGVLFLLHTMLDVIRFRTGAWR